MASKWIECPVRSVIAGTASITVACTSIILGMSLINTIV